MVIAVHHAIVILYVLICAPVKPYMMGVCLTVEANTWLLIMRRMVNKSGHTFELAGYKLKVTSILFYTTWILIRLIIYPSLIVPCYGFWVDHTILTGHKLNRMILAPIFQCAFTAMNFKWSFDLFLSKMKSRGPEKGL